MDWPLRVSASMAAGGVIGGGGDGGAGGDGEASLYSCTISASLSRRPNRWTSSIFPWNGFAVPVICLLPMLRGVAPTFVVEPIVPDVLSVTFTPSAQSSKWPGTATEHVNCHAAAWKLHQLASALLPAAKSLRQFAMLIPKCITLPG